VQAAPYLATRRAQRRTYCYDGPGVFGGVEMSTARLAFAIALALLGSKAEAGPQATARVFTADFYLAGCKDFVAGKSNFFAGRCVGAVEVLDALNSDTKLFCPPDNTDNLQRVRIIVTYIEARPERKNEDFRLLANEALARTWPCKS
jgi:Rap1a immunity proteins